MPHVEAVAVVAEGHNQKAIVEGGERQRVGTMNSIDGKMTRIRTGYRKHTWRYIGSHP